MAESNTGGWVRRVGASGGGRTYRRQRPLNYYGVIAIVCVLGVMSVAWARHTYRNPGTSPATVQPAVGTTWFAALGIATCGTQQPALAPNPNSLGGFHAISGGAIQIRPLTASQSGNNATLDKFISAYPGLGFSSTLMRVPAQRGVASASTWTTGQKCPAGTRFAGQVGQTEVAYWGSIASRTPTITTDPSAVRFTQNMLVTLYFGPKSVTPPQPPAAAIAAMLRAPTATSTTTTTSSSTTTTIKR